MTAVRTCAAALLAVAAASCSKTADRPPTYPVSGRVLFEGNPAAGAVVILHRPGTPTADRPRARADAKGEFALTTFAQNDGAPAGDYAVTVEWKRTEDHPEGGVDLLPASYGDPKTTKLKATVVAGRNEPLVLTLSRRP